MSIQMALDEENNDLIMLEGGGIARVDTGRYVVQLVRCKLQTLLGEWVLDPRKGWVSLDDFKHNPDLFDLEMRAREIILGIDGVSSIDSMDLTLSKRLLTLTFVATTQYGGIDLTIPWST